MIDYFTKWAKENPLAKIIESNVCDFVWKAIVYHFGISKVLIFNHGKQFDNPRFKEFCSNLGIKKHFSSPGHPQANSQVEVTNQTLLNIIKTQLKTHKGNWLDELPRTLWAYKTTVRTPTGADPFPTSISVQSNNLGKIKSTHLLNSLSKSRVQ